MLQSLAQMTVVAATALLQIRALVTPTLPTSTLIRVRLAAPPSAPPLVKTAVFAQFMEKRINVDAITSTGRAQLAPNATVEPSVHSMEPVKKECMYLFVSAVLILQMPV
jgi:hypothetical protein